MSARSRGSWSAWWAGALLACAVVPAAASADSASLPAAQDNTIYDEKTSNSNGSGPVMNAGKISSGKIRRALVRFDVTSSTIPAGATIDFVTLRLNITNVPASPTATTLGLYRVLRAWGEGTSSSSTGSGAGAETGDATWLVRFFPDSAWNAAGGDFDGALHGAGPLNTTLGAYVIPSAPALVQDVQDWLDHPSTANFGWMLRADESAGVTTTVRGIATRQEAGLGPVLDVTYTPFGAGVGPEGLQALRLAASPNPFRLASRFVFALPSAGAVQLAIFDVQGRRVALLADGATLTRGVHALSWDGHGTGGEPVAAGVYFARLKTPADGSRTVRVLRIR